MTIIEQLDVEIKNATKELNKSLKTQTLLREKLKSNNKKLQEILEQLKAIEAYLEDSNKLVFKLEQENLRLKLTCDEWMKRAVNLQLEVLSARVASKE